MRLPKHDDTLLAQIERDALDDSVPLSNALRKCVVLGGKANSEPLRDWATHELHGYRSEDELPEYRVINAPLLIDGIAGHHQVTGQPWPPSALPDFARDHISEVLKLRQGVGGLEALVRQSEIKLLPQAGTDLVRYMNAKSDDPYQHIVSLYWAVAPSAIRGVLDRIRTSLAQLVAELQANMPDDRSGIPSTEAANQAVNVVVTGRRSRVNVTTAQASGQEASASVGPPFVEPFEPGFWTRGRKIGAFLVGAATVVAAVVAVVQAL